MQCFRTARTSRTERMRKNGVMIRNKQIPGSNKTGERVKLKRSKQIYADINRESSRILPLKKFA